MPMLNVGDRVRMSLEGRAAYGDAPSNPYDAVGEVTRVKDSYFCYEVRWDTHVYNNYREGELELAQESSSRPNTPSVPVNVRGRIREAREYLKERWNRDAANGVALVVENKRAWRPVRQKGPCHGFLRGNGRPSHRAIVSLIVRHKPVGYMGTHAQPAMPVLEAYYDWLFKRSPWSSCFMYKSAKEALKWKSCVLKTNVPSNILQGALISTRNTWEFAPNIQLWYDLVQRGVGEHMAFIGAYFVSVNGKELTFSLAHRDHIAISTQIMRKDGAKAFLSNNPLVKTKSYRSGQYPHDVVNAFKGQGEELAPSFKEGFEQFGISRKSGLNPFTKAMRKRGQSRSMNVDQYAKFLIQFTKTLEE